MRELPEASVHAIVTDPPYGLSNHKTKSVIACLEAWISGQAHDTQNQKGFMGKEWDAWVPGPDIWREAFRVLKPGGHLLAFAGTRSMDLMSLAIRLAGFELRDSIGWAHDSNQAPLLAWVYGVGFPKSLDVGRKIDQDAGAERKVIGTKKAGMGTGKTFGMLQAEGNNAAAASDIPWSPIPVTDAARQWDGWGTGLKPAWEPIIIARKPLEESVTDTVLAHGTGALNVNGCRIPMGEEKTVRAYAKQKSRSGVGMEMTAWAKLSREDMNARQEAAYDKQEAMGRWPANVIIDDSQAVHALFPVTSQRARNIVRNNRKGPYSSDRTYNTSRTPNQVSLGYADTGSAARFFQQCKGDYNDVWQDLNLPPESANTAEQSSFQQRQAAVSALVLAASSALPEGLHCLSLLMAPSTSATGSELNLIADSVTQTIQSIDSRFWRESKPARLTLSLNHASDVEIQRLTDTTTITVSRWKLDGSAEPVTFSITQKNLEAGEKDCVPSMDSKRFMYCAKASKSDRDAGCEGIEEKRTGAMMATQNGSMLTGSGNPRTTTRANHHPTVKPTDLMRYLCRLVTPPGGVVLDPFMGSGSTGKAAMMEGFRFVGIELNPEYIEIARARIEHALKEKKSPSDEQEKLF